MKQKTSPVLYILIALFIAVALISVLSCNKEVNELKPCPDCGETNCIYYDINNKAVEGTDSDIMKAIFEVCKERGIKDSATIDLIKANYYL